MVNSQTLMDGAANFLRLGGKIGISNFTLRGPVDVPTFFSDFIILKRSDIALKDSDIFAVGKNSLNAIVFYDRALDLDIPQRIKDLKMIENEQCRNAAEMLCSLNNLPFGVLAFGKSRDTKEEVVLLGFVGGVSPENALSEFKQRIKQRKAEFN